MIRKISLLLTILAALGLVVAMASCGKKGALDPPSFSEISSYGNTKIEG